MIDKNGKLDDEMARKVKWERATNPNPYPVQKIANMDRRMEIYREKWKSFLKLMISFVVICSLLVFPVTYYLPKFLGQEDENWLIKAFVALAVLLVPVIVKFIPKRPTEKDILRDIAVRRQVGMDDSVG